MNGRGIRQEGAWPGINNNINVIIIKLYQFVDIYTQRNCLQNSNVISYGMQIYMYMYMHMSQCSYV